MHQAQECVLGSTGQALVLTQRLAKNRGRIAALVARSQSTGPVACNDTVDDHISFAQENTVLATSISRYYAIVLYRPRGSEITY